MPQKSADYAVQSLEKALALLDMLSTHADGLGVTELGQKLGMHKSTVHRLLATLVTCGYVDQDPLTDRYRPGIKLVGIGLQILGQLDFRQEAQPYLKELAEFSRETVHLSVLDNGDVVVVDRHFYPGTVTVNIGFRLPAHCTAAGKVLLAFRPFDEVRRVIKEESLSRFTANTITSIDLLFFQLDRIKVQGYAVSAEEYAEGIRAIAAPIRDHTGQPVAAVSILGPASRLSIDRMGRLITVLTETCHSISCRLGYPKPAGVNLPNTQELFKPEGADNWGGGNGNE